MTIPKAPTFDPTRKSTPVPSLGGVLAPNQRTVNWDAISKFTRPFPSPASHEFGFWFNYFWAEAIEAPDLTHAQKVKIQEALLTVFEVAPNGYTLRGDYMSLSSSQAENVLRQLLLIGFRRVALTQPKPATKLSIGEIDGKSTGHSFKMGPASQLRAKDAMDLKFSIVGEKDAKNGPNLPIGFRSDGRGYDDLNGNGFTVRARESGESEEFKKYGLDQPWHPFGNPVYKDSLFMRIGAKNRDACLQTVISVGQYLSDITHFPILSDYVLIWNAKGADGTFLAVKPFETWTNEDVIAAEAHWRKVKVVKKNGVVDHLTKQNFMHVFHMKGLKGFNTMTYFGGDAFNERAMQGIPQSHLLAEISFEQKWYYRAEKGQIELYEVAFDEIRWVKGDEVFDVLLGCGGRGKVEVLIRDEIKKVTAKYAVEKQRKENPVVAGPKKLENAERQQITALLADLYKATPGARGNIAVEKDFVTKQLPLLAAKITPLGAMLWGPLRPKAGGTGFGLPPKLPGL